MADNASANFFKIIDKKIIANILLILNKYEFVEDEDLIEKNKSNIEKRTCTRKLLLTNIILTVILK